MRELRGSESVPDLARRAGVTHSSIYRLETGEQAALSAENFARLAQAFDVTVEEMRRRAGEQPAEPICTVPLAVEWDTGLTEVQKAALLAVWRSYVPGGASS